MVHSSAVKQATGEAIYCDDIPRVDGELYLGIVTSSRAHAKIILVDPSTALALAGVEGFFSARDLTPERNAKGFIIVDDEIFRRDSVTAVGQILGVVVADSQKLAQEAACLVRVEYEDILPVILTIEDAIKHKSFGLPTPTVLVQGDTSTGFDESDHVVEGDFKIGGQDHFYLETQSVLCIPQDGDEMKVFCSTQDLSGIQNVVASVLGIPHNRIQVTAKRLGGGFGGKETGAAYVSPVCALASCKLQRPVRCMLDRNEDMEITGGRHPVYFKYKVGFTKEGALKALEATAYCNAGYSMDLSPAVIGEIVHKMGNHLRIPHVHITGWMCQTNLPSNTAFRGFGAPQTMMIPELFIRDICRVTQKGYPEISSLNMIGRGDVTYYGQRVEDNNMERCFADLLARSDYAKRLEEVEQFNEESKWKKRGISMINTVYPIGFNEPFMNQGAVLVNIYLDGSVLIENGGVEMGQGLNVKLIQVAATELKIPAESIYISGSNTNSVPNRIATAASVGTDMYGGAVLDACQKLNRRLRPVKEKNPDKAWNELISLAHMETISLSATGFYTRNQDSRYSYMVYGSSCSEVEVDCLTGDHRVIRTDIVMDLGNSVNPAIDIGQIEGGFMQGYGLYTMEEMIYSPTGHVLSKGPGTYKIPSMNNIPGQLNVSLLENSSNPRAVFSSKAVGEPPLFCASSVFFAIKEAVGAARVEEGLERHFNLSSPASVERIRMACGDRMARKVRIFPNYFQSEGAFC